MDESQTIRVSVEEAAALLGIEKGSVKKRIQRRKLRSEKDVGGTTWVFLDRSETVQDQSRRRSETDRDVLVGELRDRVRSLERRLDEERESRKRADTIIAQLTQANAALAARVPELEAPQEASDASETAEEAPDRAEPRPDTEEAQEGTEHLRQRVGGLAPVPKLPWWHYAIGLFLGFSAGFLTSLVIETLLVNQPLDIPASVFLLAMVAIAAAIAWWPPAIFGLWIGYRKRDLRFWSQVLPLGALVAGVTSLGANVEQVGLRPELLPSFLDSTDTTLIFVLPAWMFFVSASLIGNAWQRRRIGRISDATPASPVSRTAQGAAQQQRKVLTPAQQAMLGWGGGIIGALISLIGTIIIQARSGGP